MSSVLGRRDTTTRVDSASPNAQQGVLDLRSLGCFAQLALALDDLVAAISCLNFASQPNASPTPQTRRAAIHAMIVASPRAT